MARLLSERLLKIAEEVSPGERVADIGTDHGKLPLYLVEAGISSHPVLTDISRDSLEKARRNCAAHHLTSHFTFRCGDGLKVLRPGEVDTVIMAGMGGLLMSSMLRNEPDRAHSVTKYILQPRSAVGPLRYRLLSDGFRIRREQLVREGRFLCEILTVTQDGAGPGEGYPSLDEPETSIRWEVPPRMRMWEDPLCEEYLARKREREERILQYRMRSRTGNKVNETIERIRYLRMLERKDNVL